MKSFSVILVACVLLAVMNQEVGAKKRACKEKPADDNDAKVMKAIEDCEEKAVENGDDPVDVLPKCKEAAMKKFGGCGGKSKAFQGMWNKVAEKVKEIGKAIEDGDKEKGKALLKGFMDGVVKQGKEAAEAFKNRLKKAGKTMDEFTDEK